MTSPVFNLYNGDLQFGQTVDNIVAPDFKSSAILLIASRVGLLSPNPSTKGKFFYNLYECIGCKLYYNALRWKTLSVPMDNEARIRQAIMMLVRITNDTSVPRNIRRACTEAIKSLQDSSLSPGVRAANAIGILDEISQDPNMPIHTRTAIWNIVTLLETVKD